MPGSKLVIITVCAVVLSGTLFIYLNRTSFEVEVIEHTKSTMTVATSTFTVEIADDPTEREHGLSGRESLPPERVMLFIFPIDGYHGFWMKDMKFPIDIIWLNKNKEVVHAERAVSPKTYPTIFRPREPARYVLETNPGLIPETATGTQIQLEGF